MLNLLSGRIALLLPVVLCAWTGGAIMWIGSNTQAQQVQFNQQPVDVVSAPFATFAPAEPAGSADIDSQLEARLERVGPTVGAVAAPTPKIMSPVTSSPVPPLPATLRMFHNQRIVPTAAAPYTAPGKRGRDAPARFAEAATSHSTTHDLASAGELKGAPEPHDVDNVPFSDLVSDQAEQLMTREGTGSSVKIAILLATLSLAPAIVLMTTSYVRIIVVLTLLRQAFGSQQLPSTQILTALSLFVTFLVMAPTWNQIKTEAVDPYSGGQIQWQEAWQRGLLPVKQFMSRQIEIAKNEDAVILFYRYLPHQTGARPDSLQEVPINVLLPAYLVSELKVAFLLGFQIYLPFLIVDLVVSAVTVSMGMVMLPPTMVSFPMKLILFVLVDGWNLVISMLLQSFGSSYG